MEPKITIVVPVYNVETYLRECLDSIVGQNFSDMEVICIEDGSTDNSLRILQEYEKGYDFIHVYANNENRGLSVARNKGIEQARGKYIWFVDSDDWLKPQACHMLYQCAEESNVDIVYFNMDYLNDEENQLVCEKRTYSNIQGVRSGREMFCVYQKSGETKAEVFRQFIRRDFLINNQLTFYEGILHEDLLFSFLAAMKAKRVIDVNQNLYCYRQRTDSIMYSQKEKSAASIFVNLVNICGFWLTNSFSDDENLWISDYIEKMYKSYKYYRHFSDEKHVAGEYKERFLYELFNKESTYTIDFLGEDIVHLCNAESLVLYGAGRIAIEVLNVLKKYNIRINEIVVTQIKGNAQYIEGIPVIPISNLLKRKKQLIILGVDQKFHEEIIKTMRNYGFYNYVKPIKIR